MAKLIPSGVINLPNFAELQYKLNEREREKQLQFDEWSSQFAKKSGRYLDGDREAVQTAYGGVENALKELARDPENVDLRRKVREANAGYNEVAGTAQFLADNYRQQWSAYNTEPDKFSVRGQEAVSLFDQERTTKRDANQIMSLASNPFTLAPKYKYDIESPVKVADGALQFIRQDIKSFIKKDGTIDEDKVRQYAERYYDTRYIDPSQKKNAIVYEGVRQKLLGKNGEITSRSDLDIIETKEFQPEAQKLSAMFREDVLNAVMQAAPQVAIDAYTRSQDEQDLALKRAQLGATRAANQKKDPYANLTPVRAENTELGFLNMPGQKNPTGFMIPIYESKIATAGGDIVKFGKINGIPYIVQEVSATQFDPTTKKEVNVKQESMRRATDVDLNMLDQVTGGRSGEYLKLPDNVVDIMSGQSSVSSQEQRVDAFGNPIEQ